MTGHGPDGLDSIHDRDRFSLRPLVFTAYGRDHYNDEAKEDVMGRECAMSGNIG
jgi:hypothetical protein